MLSYERLSKKPIPFKSCTGLKVQEFDNIYKNEISRKYYKHEIKRLSNKKDREREIGAGRHFKLDIKNRFIMLLVYYRLYITYTLTGFLFDLDQSNVCRDVQKIESLIRKCVPIPQKTYNITKRLQHSKSNNIFQASLLLQIVLNNRYHDLKIRIEERCTILEAKRKDILLSRISLWLIKMVISFTKQNIRKEEGMIIIYKNIKRIILSLLKMLLMYMIWDTFEYKRIFQSKYHLYHIKRREIASYHKKNKSITKAIPKRG